MAQAPAIADPRKQPKTIKQHLEDPAMVSRFEQVVPRHMNPERMLRVMAQAVHETPKLLQCEPISLLGALQACASLGLEPNTVLGHAYLIPFEKSVKLPNGTWGKQVRVNLIIGYRGYIDLARRTGMLVSVRGDVVYEGDDFDFWYGTGQQIKHRPRNRSDRPVDAYAYAELKDGEAFEVLPYDRVLKVRDNSEGYKAALAAKEEAERDKTKAWRMRSYNDNPWVAHPHEMAAKTMIRRLAKWLPMSLEFASAAKLDAMSETGQVDFSVFTEAKDIEEGIAAIDHDPDTGEVPQIEQQAPVEAPEEKQAEPARPKMFKEEG